MYQDNNEGTTFSGGAQSAPSSSGGTSSGKGSALPIAAASVGLLAIGCVVFAVNKMTKR